jgi:hypothetical protein
MPLFGTERVKRVALGEKGLAAGKGRCLNEYLGLFFHPKSSKTEPLGNLHRF